MKKNIVIVHLLAFFILGYSSAIGQRQSQQASVPKQQVKAQPEQANKLTSVAKKYLQKMEKSRNHHLRESMKATPSSANSNRRVLISKLEGKRDKPKARAVPKAPVNTRKNQEVVKK